MSDKMLLGILRMPPDLWLSDDFVGTRQRQSAYIQAADRIEADAAEIERLENEIRETNLENIHLTEAAEDLANRMIVLQETIEPRNEVERLALWGDDD